MSTCLSYLQQQQRIRVATRAHHNVLAGNGVGGASGKGRRRPWWWSACTMTATALAVTSSSSSSSSSSAMAFVMHPPLHAMHSSSSGATGATAALLWGNTAGHLFSSSSSSTALYSTTTRPTTINTNTLNTSSNKVAASAAVKSTTKPTSYSTITPNGETKSTTTNTNNAKKTSDNSLLRSLKTVQLEYTDFCNPPDTHLPPVLFMHGLLGNRRNFATIARSLCQQLQRPRRIVGVDLRNHGDSGRDATMSYPHMAADVIAFLNQQHIPRAILVGHSMGGKVAQATALLAPERVDGLVVLDIAPVAYSAATDANWQTIVDILHTMESIPAGVHADKRHVDTLLQSAVPDPALRAFLLTSWDAKTKTWKIPVHDLVQQLPVLADFDPQHLAGKQYHGDVFIIHGGQSRFVRHAHMQPIAQFFPNHLLTTIKGAGHWVHAEAPEDTAALLQKYLDR